MIDASYRELHAAVASAEDFEALAALHRWVVFAKEGVFVSLCVCARSWFFFSKEEVCGLWCFYSLFPTSTTILQRTRQPAPNPQSNPRTHKIK